MSIAGRGVPRPLATWSIMESNENEEALPPACVETSSVPAREPESRRLLRGGPGPMPIPSTVPSGRAAPAEAVAIRGPGSPDNAS